MHASRLFSLLVVLGITGPAAAQPRRGNDARGSAAPAAPVAPRANERREQIKKKIRAMRAYTMTEELALDDQAAAKLFPLLARYDDETDKLLERRIELQRRLRRADTMRDSRAVERLIDDALANQRAFWALDDQRVNDLRKILMPAQVAKLLVVLPALERRIQNQLRKAIVQHRPGAPPSTIEDDDDPQPDEFTLPPKAPRRRREVPLAPHVPSTNAPGNTPPCDPSVGPCR
jgi:hypothetical protein